MYFLIVLYNHDGIFSQNFIENIRKEDNSVYEETETNFDEFTAPIRKTSQLVQSDEKKQMSTQKRIKSSDYNSWDKYDADTECLKMDLHEERDREEMEMKAKKLQKIVEISDSNENEVQIRLTKEEKRDLADK